MWLILHGPDDCLIPTTPPRRYPALLSCSRQVAATKLRGSTETSKDPSPRVHNPERAVPETSSSRDTGRLAGPETDVLCTNTVLVLYHTRAISSTESPL
ncbi:hypothetical protein B296_00010660 [Ensete ventricosum]|uniref:Uncharacterized protein n=1 Tax=Ensete ventricosum TaxID=4639 RepID=A0A427B9Y9_ENSVE|nr:hypothetical protein B296_00010660 [Ensete ventricosum]